MFCLKLKNKNFAQRLLKLIHKNNDLISNVMFIPILVTTKHSSDRWVECLKTLNFPLLYNIVVGLYGSVHEKEISLRSHVLNYTFVALKPRECLLYAFSVSDCDRAEFR